MQAGSTNPFGYQQQPNRQGQLPQARQPPTYSSPFPAQTAPPQSRPPNQPQAPPQTTQTAAYGAPPQGRQQQPGQVQQHQNQQQNYHDQTSGSPQTQPPGGGSGDSGTGPYLQRRVYPGMADQSFDTTTASSRDKVNMPQTNPFGDANQGPPTRPAESSMLDGGLPQGSSGSGAAGSANAPRQYGAGQQAQYGVQPAQSPTAPAQVQQKRSAPTSDESLPRPLRFLNKEEVRRGAASKYGTASLDFSPQPTVPSVSYDEGKAAPRFMRPTTLAAPQDQRMQTQSGIAFGVMIQPLAQPSQYDYAEGCGEVPQIDFLEDGPFRCSRCKAYVNPAFQFIQEGRKATCNLCLTETAVPDHYFCSLNEYGRRLDREKRPELLYGTYEIKAPSMFADKTPQTPTFVFFLDVSLQAFQTGFFHQCLSSIKASLESMPQPEKTRVCVATYDQSIMFYTLADENAEPQIYQVGDLTDPFIPLPASKLLMNLAEESDRVYALVDKIYNMYTQEHYQTGRQVTQVCSGAVIKAGVEALSDLGGRIMVFASAISSLGCGAVQTRSKAELFNTAEEAAKMMSPEHEFYSALGKECIDKRITVDLFLALSPKYPSVDVATMAPVCGLTGGDLYVHSDFDVTEHAEKLYYQIFRNMTRIIGTDVTMRIRCSTGLTACEYIGSFMRHQSSELSMATIDADKVVSALFRSDDKLNEGQQVHCQFAMLYSDMEGVRKIRVFNYHWQVAKNLYSYFKSADVESVAQFKVRSELSQAVRRGAKNTKEKLINDLVDMLSNYRTQCASQTNPSQLVLPETLTLLPLYLLSAVKNPAFRLLTVCKIDQKIYEIYRLISLSMEEFSYALYPRVYKLTDLGQNDSYGYVDEQTELLVKPVAQPCRFTKAFYTETLLIDNGEYLTLMVGHETPTEFLSEVFGVEDYGQLRASENLPAFVPAEGNETADLLNSLIEQIKYERVDGSTLPTKVVLYGTPQAQQVQATCFVEDTPDSVTEFAYQDFLSMLHKRIRAVAQKTS